MNNIVYSSIAEQILEIENQSYSDGQTFLDWKLKKKGLSGYWLFYAEKGCQVSSIIINIEKEIFENQILMNNYYCEIIINKLEWYYDLLYALRQKETFYFEKYNKKREIN